MPRRGPRGYRGPRWDRYIGKKYTTPGEDTAKILEQIRKDKEFYLDQATTAAMGNRYAEAEHYLELAGWPIEREQTVAPPEGSSGMVVRGPGAAQNRSGRALFADARGQGGAMAPADQMKDPAGLMKMLTERFMADKELPTSVIPQRFGEKERLVGMTPKGGYKDLLPEQAGPPTEGKTITLGPDEIAYDAKGKEIARGKDAKEKDKDVKGVIVKPGERLVDQSTGDVLFVAPGGDRALQEQNTKAQADMRKNLVKEYKDYLAEIRVKYKGMEKLIDALMAGADKGMKFEELGKLAKNGYELLKKAARAPLTGKSSPEAVADKEEALKDLAHYEAFYNALMTMGVGTLPPVAEEGPPPPALGEGVPNAADYIKNALGEGTQL